MADVGLKYAPPEVTPLPFIAFDKHHARSLLPTFEFSEKIDARSLLSAYGSPLYVISEERLRHDFRNFEQAFKSTKLKTQVAYSVKTNYLPAVCSVLREEGAWAEVVSEMEYQLSRAVGVPPNELIYNGPHKTREQLERALSEGAIVNIDNFDELSLVEHIADELRRDVRIGIRVSFRHGTGSWVKFGFSDDTDDAQKALRRIARNKRLKLELLHHHGGTFLLVHEVYAQATRRLIELAKRARAMGLRPTMIDLGGGFPSSNCLKADFDFPGGSVRVGDFWDPYAQAILPQLEKARDVFGGRPTLVLEPGRAVVDASTQLLCSVTAIKRIPKEGTAVMVDAGVNLVPTVCYYDHHLTPADDATVGTTARTESVDVYGPLCMQSDKLRTSVTLPKLAVGDPLSISHVGAYSHTQSMQFIQTRPATVLLGPDGPELIRRAETWRDVFALDQIPERLRADACEF